MDSAAIEKRIALLQEAQNEYKVKKDMLQGAISNDEELIGLDDDVKEIKRKHTLHKQALMNEPENRKIVEDMKDLAQDIKDTKALLGDELVAYFMANNTMEYTSPDGEKRRFRVSAQFVGKDKEER